ncbi:hypothetical protein D3C75_1157660 [compost metagenome]
MVAVANHRGALYHPFQFQIVTRPQVQTKLGHYLVVYPEAALEVLLQGAQMRLDQQRDVTEALA